MKLVRGKTLAYAAGAGATINASAVFEGVCQTLAYAHAHGVIHRDLKPANIMVGAFGEVQVMDWGLAKTLASGGRPPAVEPSRDATPDEKRTATAIGTPRTPDTETLYGSVMGTPAFMPPEQAAGEADKVDRRSDVFGLGAILCVLLTGKPPYQGETADAVRLMAVRGQTAAAFARLDASGAEQGMVTLCKRCLAADPADRPADAAAVAAEVADLRLAAEDRARQAELGAARAAVSAAERRKRRRVVAAAGGLLVAALAAGAAASAWQAVRATEAERRAEADRDAAVAARQAADGQAAAAVAASRAAAAAKEFLQSVLVQGSPAGYATKDRPAKENMPLAEALDYASREIDGKFAGQPETEADLRTTIGEAYLLSLNYTAARPHLTAALCLRETALGPDALATLASVNSLAALAHGIKDYTTAEPLYRRVLAGREKTLGPDHHETLYVVGNLAELYKETGGIAAAEPMYKRAVAGLEKKWGPDSPDTLWMVAGLAAFYYAMADYTAAEPLFRRVVAGYETALGPDHPVTLSSVLNLGAFYDQREDYAAAEPLFKRALAGREKTLGADHPATLMSVNNLGVFYFRSGDAAAAVPLLRRAAAGFAKALGPDHPSALMALSSLARAAATAGDSAAGLSMSRQAAEAAEKRAFNFALAGNIVNNHATLLERRGEYADAEAWRRKWLARSAGEFPAAADDLAENLLAQKKYPAAETTLRECLAAREKLLAAKQSLPWQVANTRSMLGESLCGQAKYADAEPLLVAGYEGLAADAKLIPAAVRQQRLFDAGFRLVVLYDATNRPAEAAAWRAKLGREPAPPPRPGG